MLTLRADRHSQLLNHVEEAIRNWEDGKATDTIYLDFAKAFDKVPHLRLIKKCEGLGIQGDILRWILEWLFLIFINDIDIACEVSGAHIIKFADDTKLSQMWTETKDLI